MKPLSSIRVLYRAPDTLCLYGIPYKMRPGQSPRDIWGYRDHPEHGWIWLGSCGWFGDMSKERQAEVKAFLRAHHDEIPQWPFEWVPL